MKLAVHCYNLSWPEGAAGMRSTLSDIATTVDQGGVETLTMMDHWFQMEPVGGPAEPMLEGYTSLGFLAGRTERVELGLLVTGVTYRYPGLLAKIATTLDVLSGGRAMLGLGAAWYEREHLGLGVPFPPLKERFERLEEALQICRQMFAGDTSPYEGAHYQLAEPVNLPAPLQSGGPRIMLGGSGEKKTLRMVAQYADATNLFGLPPEELAHKIEVLDGHCADVGRDPSEISRTVMAGGPGLDPVADTDAFLARAEAYAGLGIGQLFVGPPPTGAVEWTEKLVSEVKPRLDSIG